ncbi:MAG: hypothetical protein PHW59_08025 [Desulfobacterales bacterium]|nr:hypothetical protein [Desulfobacterales bacterium]
MPETTENLEESILRNAAGPKSAEVDGQKVEQHSLPEQIAADEYLEKKKVMRSRGTGLKITQMHHSGA